LDSGPKTSGHRKVAYRNLEKGIALLGHGVDHDGVHPSAMPPVSNFMGVPVHKVPVSSAAEISSELEGVATFQDRDNLHSSLGTNVRQENSAGSILRHRPETSISSFVRVSGLQVSHLPKMDRMGKCDPYVVLELGGVQQRTKTLKNRYDAAFEEEFEFCDLEVEARAAEYLVFRVKDWDRFGKDEEIGVASIALGRDTALVVSVNQDHCLLGKKGKVFGHDGHATRISFVVSVRVYTDGPQKLESETAALRDSVGSLSSDDADASPSVAAGVEFSQRSPWVVRAPRVENVSENDKEQRENMSPSTTSADCNAVDVGRTSRTSLSPLQTPPQGLGEWEVAVTVHQVINLPKVDRNGTANPFVCCSLVRDDLLLHPNTIMHDCSEANRDSHYDHGVYAMPPCFRSQILRNRFSTRLKLFICCKQRFQSGMSMWCIGPHALCDVMIDISY
jgi:hypothetical protein